MKISQNIKISKNKDGLEFIEIDNGLAKAKNCTARCSCGLVEAKGNKR